MLVESRSNQSLCHWNQAVYSIAKTSPKSSTSKTDTTPKLLATFLLLQTCSNTTHWGYSNRTTKSTSAPHKAQRFGGREPLLLTKYLVIFVSFQNKLGTELRGTIGSARKTSNRQ